MALEVRQYLELNNSPNCYSSKSPSLSESEEDGIQEFGIELTAGGVWFLIFAAGKDGSR